MADLKLVYAAPTEETALNELELFKDKWDSKCKLLLLLDKIIIAYDE